MCKNKIEITKYKDKGDHSEIVIFSRSSNTYILLEEPKEIFVINPWYDYFTKNRSYYSIAGINEVRFPRVRSH